MLVRVNERLEDPSPQLNTTPLIDVMLVMLVMFMLTIPAMTHSIRLDPAQGARRDGEVPPVAAIDVDYDGSIYWNDRLVPLAEVAERTRSLLARSGNAELRVRAARLVRYEYVAKFLAEAERNGAHRISFLGNERFL